MVPFWFMIAVPSMWLILLPLDFIVCTVVLFLSSKLFSVGGFKDFYKKTILKALAVNLTSQIIGSLFLFLSQGNFGEWWYEFITTPVALNPLDNVYALVFTVAGIAVAGIASYFFHRKITLAKLDLSEKLLRSTALTLAVLTLPTMYLLPSRMLYDPETPVANFTNHLVWSVQTDCDVEPAAPVAAGEVTLRTADGFEYGYALAEAVNFAQAATSTVEREAEYRLTFANPDGDRPAAVTAELWFLDTGLALFRVNGRFYLADEFQSERTLSILSGTYTPPVYDDYEETEDAAS